MRRNGNKGFIPGNERSDLKQQFPINSKANHLHQLIQRNLPILIRAHANFLLE
jgi:hypothetical protein